MPCQDYNGSLSRTKRLKKDYGKFEKEGNLESGAREQYVHLKICEIRGIYEICEICDTWEIWKICEICEICGIGGRRLWLLRPDADRIVY